MAGATGGRSPAACRADKPPLDAHRAGGYRDIGEVIEDLGAAIGRTSGAQQVWALLDERRRDLSRFEVGVVQDRLQEAMFVATPRTLNSAIARRARRTAVSKSRPRQVSLTSSESKCADTSAPIWVPRPTGCPHHRGCDRR
jgi:hypothetical protein